MATHIACCQDTLALVLRGTVYAGELTGDGVGVRTLPVLEPLPSLPVPVRRIGAGKGFLGITTADGELYTWGRNLYGQLGLDFSSSANVTTPTLVRQFVFQAGRVQVHDFAGGWDHSVVITDHGVFACGNNSNGTLGNDEVEGESHRFYPVKYRDGSLLKNASCVASGNGHTVLLDGESVCTWGSKDYQCLGKYDITHVRYPRPLPLYFFGAEDIVYVDAGECHQAAVSAQGTVFTWGNGRFYKLGDGNEVDCTRPTRVLFERECLETGTPVPHIETVLCGSKCTVMLARDGRVFKAGKRDDESSRFALPRLLESECVGPVRAAAATSERVFAVDERGALWAWGVDVPFVFDRELAGAPVHRGVVWRGEHTPMRLDPPEWRSAHALAFAMLGHHRLGAGSCFGMLDVSLLDMILRFLRAW
jgi:alpha-tubulin suppressor-like RCC1 family protein